MSLISVSESSESSLSNGTVSSRPSTAAPRRILIRLQICSKIRAQPDRRRRPLIERHGPRRSRCSRICGMEAHGASIANPIAADTYQSTLLCSPPAILAIGWSPRIPSGFPSYFARHEIPSLMLYPSPTTHSHIGSRLDQIPCCLAVSPFPAIYLMIG